MRDHYWLIALPLVDPHVLRPLPKDRLKALHLLR